MKIYDVLILGGGASGLMCAGNLSKKKVLGIVDTNDKVAKKVKISGGGKCNITNINVTNIHFDGNRDLINAALKKFSKESLLQFLQRNSIELELRKGCYYFCQHSSQEIIDVLSYQAHHADFLLQHKIIDVKKQEALFEVKTDKETLLAKNVVVATGGKSFTNLGASDIGLEIAKSFDIKVQDFTPALVGLTLQKEQFWMKELSGLSCYVRIEVEDRVLEEEMLFAHKGISGPAILSASLYWRKGDISIDFLPSTNIVDLVSGSKKLISSSIPLPKRLSKALLQAIDIEDKECRKISPQELQALKRLHKYEFSPAGNFGFTKAEVSRGGVLAEELYSSSLESKKVKGLYFIGEVVDVTGELGGYNFQWAFSSAYLCAKAIK